MLPLSTPHICLQPEPYQPHPIPVCTPYPHDVTRGPKFILVTTYPPEKASIPKLKYEALEISEVGGAFERKVLIHCSSFGLLSKQSIYTLQLLLGAL